MTPVFLFGGRIDGKENSMTQNRMVEIAKVLGAIYKELSDCAYALSLTGAARQAHIAKVTPEGGWPGKNPEERKAAESKTLTADPELAAIAEAARKIEARQSELTGQRDALEAERRALEWTVRENLVNALIATRTPQDDAYQDAAFDAAATEAATKAALPPEPPDYGDIPF